MISEPAGADDRPSRAWCHLAGIWHLLVATRPVEGEVKPCPSSEPQEGPAMIHGLCQTSTSVGAWRSLVARIVRDDEVGGSNPLAPTKLTDLAVKLQDRGQRGV